MAEITLRGQSVQTVGTLPGIGEQAPNFELVGPDLEPVRSADFAGKTLVLNIFPSVDTGVCAASVRAFNQEAAGWEQTVVLNVSKDLPFALGRFCGAEGLEGVQTASAFRSEFGEDYGVTMISGGLTGLLARAVVVVDPQGRVLYTEQVPEIGQEPDYAAAVEAVRSTK